MDKQQYMEKLNQGGYHAMSQPVEATPTADSPLPYLELGSSFLIGLAVGYFIKKSFKIVLFILGFSLILIFFMESQGVLTLNEQVLEKSISEGSTYFEFIVSSIQERITSFKTGIGAGAGFLVGLKIG
jgi:uncharacterized membrane protein (Fun14 family)